MESMIRKHALGLDPRVDAGFPKTSCAIENLRRDRDSIQHDRALGRRSTDRP
jgi:hypothetical protein